MSRSRYSPPRLSALIVAAFGMATLLPVASAQPVPKVKLKEPTASRVYQRGLDDRADIPIVLGDDAPDDAKVIEATIAGPNMALDGIRFVDGKLTGVPVGGPYTITCRVQVKQKPGNPVNVVNTSAGPVFVGDLWVLSGQSNMEGVGDLVDVTPPHPEVMMLGMDGHWKQAEEPLHWLVDSPDPVHSGDPKTREKRSAQAHKHRRKGAGLGLPFAVALTESTGVPIGLVICAHGGTSMAQWNPDKKDEGGNSLYGSMMRQFHLAGGNVKGVLWYQGESDSSPEASPHYGQNFTRFIHAVRSDFNQPELPFYFVQIGRFVHDGDPKGWKTVQEAQRRLPERVPNTALISVIDLELDDLIHVGTQGQKRAGHRLARIAQRELFDQVGATTPTLDSVVPGPSQTLVVRFKGVNRGHPMSHAPQGAMMGMMGQMEQGGNVPPPGAGGMMGGRGRRGMGRGMGRMMMRQAQGESPGENGHHGLQPERHIAGFSIRKEDGTKIPIVYEAHVGRSRDTVILKLSGKVPPKSFLWYGYGLDPYCNLIDSMDMAVPAFGPIALDEILDNESAQTSASKAPAAKMSKSEQPIKALVITGDNVSAHKWRETSNKLKSVLESVARIKVDITTTPSKDLTDENLAKYDVLILNYRETPNGSPESRWSDANKEAFLKAVRGGKGLVGYHYASAAFAKPNWEEFEKAVAGGWRTQGFHGPAHEFKVKKTDAKHPISEGLPHSFDHSKDELYQNSMLTSGSEVLATAYSDPGKPRGTGKDEPVIWVNHYGKGRVFEDVLGHDTNAMSDPNYQKWLRRGVIWAATGKVD